MGVTVSRWARLANSGTTPPNAAWRSIWLATRDERTDSVSSTTAAAVSSHEVSIASTVRLTGPPGRRRWRPVPARPRAPTHASGPLTFTNVEGTSCSSPPSTTRSTVAPRQAATSRAVRGVGAPWGLALVTASTPVRSRSARRKSVIGDTHRHLGPTVQPGRPVELGREAERQRQRPRPPAPGQHLGPGREGHTERAHLRHGGGQNGKVHALGPALHAIDGLHRVGVGRPRRQAVDGVRRDDGDAAATQPLRRDTHTLAVGAYDPHRLGHLRSPGGLVRAGGGGRRSR